MYRFFLTYFKEFFQAAIQDNFCTFLFQESKFAVLNAVCKWKVLLDCFKLNFKSKYVWMVIQQILVIQQVLNPTAYS